MKPQRIQAILEERARNLARVPVQPPRPGELVELLLFRLGDEQHALDLACTLHVLRYLKITPVPGCPAHLLGVINLRGEILPVFDARRLLGVSESIPAKEGWLIVLGNEWPELALFVDAVTDVVRRRADEIHDPQPGSRPEGTAPLRGVCRDALVIHSSQSLLADERLIIDLADPQGNGPRGR